MASHSLSRILFACLEEMYVLIPTVCFLALFYLIYSRGNKRLHWRHAFLSASILWGVLLVGLTESLSALGLITFVGLAVSWGLSFCALLLLHILLPKKSGERIRADLGRSSGFEISLLAIMSVLMLLTGISAYVAPPNTWDSMTYHMSRVMHWVQNGSVSHYPTHIQRQLFLNPGSEFAILHFQILSGGDRFANMVQWASMIGSMVGISAISKELGAGIRGQIMSVLVAITIPMGILQSSRTQNDYVVSFWLICFVYFLLLCMKNGTRGATLMMGLSFGLAILTKATAYVYSVPFLVWFFIGRLKVEGKKILKQVALLLFVIACLNAGHFARNIELYGHPISPSSYRNLNTNNLISFRSIASNLIRNTALHLGTPINTFNKSLEKTIDWIHIQLSFDLNDNRTTFSETKFGIFFSRHEDLAGNLVHTLLILACAPFILFLRKEQESVLSKKYFITVITCFLVFCTAMKWNPWNSRYHLPFFLLISPPIGIFLSGSLNRKILAIVVIILTITSLPWVLFNSSRPLLGLSYKGRGHRILSPIFAEGTDIFNASRIDLYFSNCPQIKGAYVNAADFLKSRQIKKVGLVMGANDWEYPFFPLLKSRNESEVRIEHINVKNVSHTLSNDFLPQAVICLDCEEDALSAGSDVYRREWSFADLAIFVK